LSYIIAKKNTVIIAYALIIVTLFFCSSCINPVYFYEINDPFHLEIKDYRQAGVDVSNKEINVYVSELNPALIIKTDIKLTVNSALGNLTNVEWYYNGREVTQTDARTESGETIGTVTTTGNTSTFSLNFNALYNINNSGTHLIQDTHCVIVKVKIAGVDYSGKIPVYVKWER